MTLEDTEAFSPGAQPVAPERPVGRAPSDPDPPHRQLVAELLRTPTGPREGQGDHLALDRGIELRKTAGASPTSGRAQAAGPLVDEPLPEMVVQRPRDTELLAGGTHIAQLLAQIDAPIVLIWDRLNAHRAYVVQDFLAAHPQLVTEFFPSCAPELNPMEYVWGYLKLNPLANLAFYDLDQPTTTARRHGRSLQRKPELLRSSLRHSPLPLRLI